MSWLRQLFNGGPDLPQAQLQRLESWRQVSVFDARAPLVQSRFVVVDVETSGLDPTRDQLIAIGAVAVNGGQVCFADSFEVVLRQERPSAGNNILVHGIGGTAQAAGLEPAEALLQFLEYLGRAPLVAFHAAFDQAVLGRALKRFLGLKFEHDWLDLAYVAPALYPRLAARNRSLDDWAAYFNITNFNRHSALADAYATAQLFLALSHVQNGRDILTFGQLQDLERGQRRMHAGG